MSRSLFQNVCAVALLLGVLGAGFVSSTFAASTVDTFSFASPEHSERYRGLIAEIRCPKCQNVNIAGSDAPIAKDLRITVHRLLGEGKTDAEILAFLQARYGDFVLYDPPLRANTLLLWLLPLAGFVGAVLVIVRLARRQPDSAGAQELSAEEARRLDRLLSDSVRDESGAGLSASGQPSVLESR